MSVRRAVIPVAGRGTRLLPLTHAVPKELCAIVDRPALHHVMEEAADAGIEEVILVVPPEGEKDALLDYFADPPDHERAAPLRELLGRVRVRQALQPEPLGLGHAVLCAAQAVGDEPFAVMLPDDLFLGAGPAVGELMAAHAAAGGGQILLQEVPADRTHRYGIAACGPAQDGRLPITGLVEKPPPGTAPSRLAIIGRYVLPPSIFRLLERTGAGAGGEIQLTDALRGLIDGEGLTGVTWSGRRFDAGQAAGVVIANVAFALARDDLAGPVRAALSELLGP